VVSLRTEETAPDEGADPSEDDTQLVDAGRLYWLAHGQSVPRKTLCFKVSPRNLALSIESATRRASVGVACGKRAMLGSPRPIYSI